MGTNSGGFNRVRDILNGVRTGDGEAIWKDNTRPEDLVEAGEEIPQYAWLAFPLEEVTDNDIEWAKMEIENE